MSRLLLGLILAASSFGSNGSPLAGSWKGDLDGLTAVRLRVKESKGQVSGSIVFYMIRKDEKGARIDGEANCELLQVAAQGKRMTFEVKHHVKHDSPEYGPNVKFVFEVSGENEGVLRKVSEGEDSVRLVREPSEQTSESRP
jgi:hypothetical protein